MYNTLDKGIRDRVVMRVLYTDMRKPNNSKTYVREMKCPNDNVCSVGHMRDEQKKTFMTQVFEIHLKIYIANQAHGVPW